jgi:acetoin utilization deacetylase AcuC-like enzyme
MPSVGYVYDPLYLEHGTHGHPEEPARLQALVSHLKEAVVLRELAEIKARDATPPDLELVHSPDLIERVRSAARAGGAWLDPDTYVVSRSYEAALRAAGGLLAATDAVLDGEVTSVFCLVRPPGHHATRDRAMGFCLFNNVAIAAAHALERRGLERVAIVDFDVHHGNGTQEAFYAEPRVLYASTHQYPFYPGSGNWRETGAGPGEGTTVNLPLPFGCGRVEYLQAYRDVVAPLVRRFQPQMLFVSAGFDAHFADPLAQMRLDTRGYYEIASLLKALADELCEGRIVYTLEGGYDHTALACSVRACIDSLLGNDLAEDPLGDAPAVAGLNIDALLTAVKRVHGLGD